MDNNGLHGLTLGSLFDGIGGFPFAAELSGVKPLWAAEVNPFCVALTRQLFPDMVHYGNVAKLSGADLPPVDIISFGSPCQDVSVAGKRKGIKHTESGDEETTRSGMFFEAIRIIYEMREATNGRYPTFIVWENVAGAFTSNSGGDFRKVLEEITKTDIPMPTSGKWARAGMVRGGAICVCWRLLDGQYWRVPQRRKRIYLVGSFGSDCAAEILFKRDSVRRYLATRRESWKETGRGFGSGAEYGCSACENRKIIYAAGFKPGASAQARGIAFSEELSPTITATHSGSGMIPAALCRLESTKSYIYDGRGNGNGQVSPTMTGDHNNRVSDYGAIVLQEHTYSLQGNMIGRQDKNGPQGRGINKDVCFTLNTTDIHGVVYAIDRAAFNQGKNAKYDINITNNGVNPSLVAKGPSAIAYETFIEWVVRLLTPLECERLQGYPDGWTILQPLEDMTDEEYEFFLWVWKQNKEIKGQKFKNVPNKQKLIRWHNKLCVDSARYEALGNSLAIPCALRVVGYIADYVKGVKKNAE